MAVPGPDGLKVARIALQFCSSNFRKKKCKKELIELTSTFFYLEVFRSLRARSFLSFSNVCFLKMLFVLNFLFIF